MMNLMSEQRRGRKTPVAERRSGQQRESREASLACYRSVERGTTFTHNVHKGITCYTL